MFICNIYNAHIMYRKINTISQVKSYTCSLTHYKMLMQVNKKRIYYDAVLKMHNNNYILKIIIMIR